MKQYHSIEYWNKGVMGANVFAFDKLDGSNLRFEWTQKDSKKNNNYGFIKFGTRNQIIGPNDEQWGEGIHIFMEKYGPELDKIFRTNKQFRNSKKITSYAEFYGENSFAGWHDPKEKGKMQLTLFDVDVYQKGFMKPREFVKLFQKFGIPEIIFEGEYNKTLVENVKNNIYNLKEGVVVKGIRLTKRKNTENVWMVKIKTNEWLQKIKGIYGEDQLLKELNGDKSLMI